MKRHITILAVLLSMLAGVALWRATRTQAAPFAATIRVPEDQPTIQAAINAANAGDTVDVKAGTYDTKVVLDKAITVKCRTGTGDDCIVQGTGGVEINILFEFNGAGVVTVLDGFTVRRGTGVGTIFGTFEFNDLAGGMYIRNGARPVIRNCKILENRAVQVTAGITVADAFPEFSNCLIGDNLGVGMRVVGTSIATINGCTFRGNSSVGLALGVGSLQTAIVLRGRSKAIVNNSRFEDNGDSGLELLTRYPDDSKPSAIVTGSVFKGNGWFTLTAGSGITATSAETLSLTNCAVLFNTGKNGGGGISTIFTQELALTNTLVVGNKVTTPDAGGASAVQTFANNKITVTNCTISGHAVSTQLTMLLWATTTSMVTNTILWGNTSTKDIYSLGNSTASNCDTQNGMEGIVDGGGNLSVNPLFVRNALTNNATDAGDLRLQNTSPVKDRGTLNGVNLDAFPQDTNNVRLDYAMQPRLTCDGLIDMGAYENQTLSGTLFSLGTPKANGIFGVPYASTVAASPAAPTDFSYQYTLANGTQLPSGLTLSSLTGAITGTPFSSGVFNFDINVELLTPFIEPMMCSVTRSFTITVCPNLSVTPVANTSVILGRTSASLPYTAGGNPNRYSIDYDAAANSAGFADVTNAVLPASPITLPIPAMAPTGNYNATITVFDSATNCASSAAPFTLRVLPCPTSFTVNTTSDTQDAVAGNGVCADASGNCSLRAAISEANALKAQSICTGNLTITLPAGTYLQTLTATGENANAGGDWNIASNLTIVGAGTGSTFVQAAATPNTASDRVFWVVSGTVALRDLTIAYGKVTGSFSSGGGILNLGTLTLNNCKVTDNMISGSNIKYGGGITNQGTLNLIKSTVSGNTVGGGGLNFGGGILNQSGNTLTLTDSTVSGNTISNDGTNYGGGICNLSTLKVNNSTVSGNAINAGGFGGGIFSNSTLDLTSSTLSNNTVSGGSTNAGGGMHNDGGLVNIRNTIVAGNTSTVHPDVSGGFTSRGNNLIGSDEGSGGFTNGVNGDQVGTAANPINALLSALGNYGGPTQTQALLPGSPAINAGNNCVLDNSCSPNPLGSNLTLDQRGTGFNRKTGTQVDIGAFESQGFALKIAGGNGQSAPVGTGFTNPLAVMVTANNASEPVNGGRVSFTPPASGASAALATSPALIASGQASVTATANTVTGSYSVTANTTPSLPMPVSFNLTNSCPTITATVGGGGAICAGGGTTVTVSVSGGIAPYTVTLNNGGGTQTGSGPVFTFNVNPANTTTYSVQSATDANNCAVTASGSATVTVNQLPVATAGGAQTICQTQTTGSLGGNTPPSGTVGAWTSNSGGSFSSTSAPNATWTPPANFSGVATLTWTVSSIAGCGTTQTANVMVTVNGNPVAAVGAAQTIGVNQTSAPLGSGPLPYATTGQWTSNSGGTFSNANDPAATWTPPANFNGIALLTWTVNSTAGCGVQQTGTVQVTVSCAAITFSPASLAAAPAGTAYSQALTVTPTGNYTFSLVLGSLPSGLTLNPTTGLISGLPSGTGTFNFTLKAQASNGCSATQAYTLVLNCPTITLPGSIATPTINTAYSQTLAASPAGTYSYAVTAEPCLPDSRSTELRA